MARSRLAWSPVVQPTNLHNTWLPGAVEQLPEMFSLSVQLAELSSNLRDEVDAQVLTRRRFGEFGEGDIERWNSVCCVCRSVSRL